METYITLICILKMSTSLQRRVHFHIFSRKRFSVCLSKSCLVQKVTLMGTYQAVPPFLGSRWRRCIPHSPSDPWRCSRCEMSTSLQPNHHFHEFTMLVCKTLIWDFQKVIQKNIILDMHNSLQITIQSALSLKNTKSQNRSSDPRT